MSSVPCKFNLGPRQSVQVCPARFQDGDFGERLGGPEWRPFGESWPTLPPDTAGRLVPIGLAFRGRLAYFLAKYLEWEPARPAKAQKRLRHRLRKNRGKRDAGGLIPPYRTLFPAATFSIRAGAAVWLAGASGVATPVVAGGRGATWANVARRVAYRTRRAPSALPRCGHGKPGAIHI
jgi:hypothetical protein